MLRKDEGLMLEQIFKDKVDLDGKMNLCQFLLLAMERNLVSNKFGLKVFKEVFKQASEGKEYLIPSQFGSIILLIATTMFKNSPNPNEKLLTYILTYPKESYELTFFESSNTKEIGIYRDIIELLSEPTLDVLLKYEPFTRSLYAKYLPENINLSEKAVTWKEVEEQNTKMPVMCLIRLLLTKFIIPEAMEVETVQEIIHQTVKPRSLSEQNFYQNRRMMVIVEKPGYLKIPYLQQEDEPLISYSEFQLILGRLSYHMPTSGEKKLTTDEKIVDFFVERLGYTQQRDLRSAGPSPVKQEESFDMDLIESDEYDSESDEDDPYKQMDILQQRREEAMKRYKIEINYEEIDKELAELPPVPPTPEEKDTKKPPATAPIQQLGRIKERKKKEVKKTQQQRLVIKKPVYRRGEAPPKPIKFAEKPKPYPLGTLGEVRQYYQEIIKPIISKNVKMKVGTSHVAACLIKEVYFPPDAPLDVATLIESANVYLINQEYELSASTFEEARELWKKHLQGGIFKTDYDLFFELSIANVIESAGLDEAALMKYISAKNICIKGMPSHHPDRAIPFCGIGSVLYHLEEYSLALRAYLQSKEIREETLGGNTVDTATTYNNLGCCMMALGRYQEAKAYLMLSQAILQMELGPTHERTMTALENSEKAKKMPIVPKPEFAPHWNIYVVDRCPVKKRGGKKKKKPRR